MSEPGHDSHSDSQPDYSGVMSTYKQLEGMGLKAEADAVMSSISQKFTPEHPAPPEVIQAGLEGEIKQHEAKSHQQHGQNHGTAHSTSLSPRFKAGLGLAAIVTFMVMAASGIPAMPYMPPPLY